MGWTVGMNELGGLKSSLHFSLLNNTSTLSTPRISLLPLVIQQRGVGDSRFVPVVVCVTGMQERSDEEEVKI
jgi:hypothetical protein